MQGEVAHTDLSLSVLRGFFFSSHLRNRTNSYRRFWLHAGMVVIIFSLVHAVDRSCVLQDDTPSTRSTEDIVRCDGCANPRTRRQSCMEVWWPHGSAMLGGPETSGCAPTHSQRTTARHSHIAMVRIGCCCRPRAEEPWTCGGSRCSECVKEPLADLVGATLTTCAHTRVRSTAVRWSSRSTSRWSVTTKCCHSWNGGCRRAVGESHMSCGSGVWSTPYAACLTASHSANAAMRQPNYIEVTCGTIFYASHEAFDC